MHTPGPWKWLGEFGHSALNSASGEVLDYANYEGMWLARYDKEEDAANARLIAAAPELLEALNECTRFLVSHLGYTKEEFVVLQARNAIAKATGEK